MADDTAMPTTDADIQTPPETTDFRPAEPLKDTGVSFDPAGAEPARGGAGTSTAPGSGGDAKSPLSVQTLRDGAGQIGQQATDRVRQFALDGKTRATDALGQLSQMLTDAAEQVDDKLGAQYGDYARNAAGQVEGIAAAIRDKDVDVLFDDVRGYVRRSPGVAIGVAAALGFAAARLVQSGLDSNHDRA